MKKPSKLSKPVFNLWAVILIGTMLITLPAAKEEWQGQVASGLFVLGWLMCSFSAGMYESHNNNK